MQVAARRRFLNISSIFHDNGCKAKIAHYNLKPVGNCSLDVKIRLQNERGEGCIVRKLITVRDGKVAYLMEYSARLASLYLQDSSRKLTGARLDSALVECTASATETDQRNQMRRYFMEKNAVACQAFKMMRIIRPKQSSDE
mmetsp:Transcript_6917/g.10093  ORF Transcript_6917/g.10093 Transcript_6917/m.10093 type:complete len:142 (-) Transcript_6917:14-439(-)